MVIDEHRGQFDYDLMTMTGRTLQEYLDMGGEGIIALAHFAVNLGLDSATICAESGFTRQSEWTYRMKTNAILADIYDAIQAFSYIFAKSKSKRKNAKKPKPYPRPWVEPKTQKFGKDPIPVSRFKRWWNSKRKRKNS